MYVEWKKAIANANLFRPGGKRPTREKLDEPAAYYYRCFACGGPRSYGSARRCKACADMRSMRFEVRRQELAEPLTDVRYAQVMNEIARGICSWVGLQAVTGLDDDALSDEIARLCDEGCITVQRQGDERLYVPSRVLKKA